MRHQALRSLPVMSGKRLLGIVTVSDLLSLLETEEA
jgi:CBS domain-containing protein